jgi:hypothetical protein
MTSHDEIFYMSGGYAGALDYAELPALPIPIIWQVPNHGETMSSWRTRIVALLTYILDLVDLILRWIVSVWDKHSPLLKLVYREVMPSSDDPVNSYWSADFAVYVAKQYLRFRAFWADRRGRRLAPRALEAVQVVQP